MGQRFLEREMMNSLLVGAFAGETLDQPGAFLRTKPLRILRTVSQVRKNYETCNKRRQPLHDEHPLPSLETPKSASYNTQDPAGQGGTNQRRERHCHHERADYAGADFGGKPVGEIENNPRKKAGFSNAKYEPQSIEARIVPDECMADRQDTPGDHDAGDPDACAGLLKDQVAGHLEQEIAQEEDARTKAECRR